MRTFSYLKSIFLFSTALIVSTVTWAGHHDVLSGNWSHNGSPTSINKNHFGQYIFCNEERDCATGFLAQNHIIEVPKWSVTGKLVDHLNSIVWSNGTQWFRYVPHGMRAHAGIEGRWHHNGRSTYIESDRSGRRFTLTNEMRQTNRGFQEGNQLILPELNITGRLSHDGTRIFWSNNTTWVR